MSKQQRPGIVWTRRTAPMLAGLGAVALVASSLVATGDGGDHATAPVAHQTSYILEGAPISTLRREVRSAGATVRESLPIIDGVVASLDAPQARRLARLHGLRLVPDGAVEMSGFASERPHGPAPTAPTPPTPPSPPTAPSTPSTSAGANPPALASPSGSVPLVGGPPYDGPAVTGSSQLWAAGDEGQGVTVAVLDTGIDASLPDLAGRVVGGVDLTGGDSPFSDEYGHGTFVAGLIAGDGASSGGTYSGEAPGANLVSIKVAGADGVTSVGTVIAGIAWAIAHHGGPNGIRVLNLSLGVAPSGPADTEPLDQAVEAAWNSGITVVTSAGNDGPTNGSISSPGDDPDVITVGALDSTSGAAADGGVPAFSGVGPTEYDGAIKPDLVAPGRSVVSLADPGSTVFGANPTALVGTSDFLGSGTSFSAAITSGDVALLLQAEPGLSPDQVKAALLLSAAKGPVGNPLVDGHGVTDVAAAVALGGVSLDQPDGLGLGLTGSAGNLALSSSWAASSWNPANWSGPAWNSYEATIASESAGSTSPAPAGLSWNGAAWNGAAWNGAAWNGAAWNGAAWNGAAWNGAAWNGAAWNGAAWNGAAWNGAAWNGAAWNGAAWNGAAWS